MELIRATPVVRVHQDELGRVFTLCGDNVRAPEPEQVLLEPAPLVQTDALFGSGHRNPADLPQAGNNLRRWDEGIPFADTRLRGHREHRRS